MTSFSWYTFVFVFVVLQLHNNLRFAEVLLFCDDCQFLLRLSWGTDLCINNTALAMCTPSKMGGADDAAMVDKIRVVLVLSI